MLRKIVEETIKVKIKEKTTENYNIKEVPEPAWTWV